MKNNVNISEIMALVDHTLLAPSATEEQIRAICDDAKKYKTASVCIPASYVSFAKNYLGGEIPVCTVIGFPCGYSTTEVKCAETAQALADGADEIDMVINIGALKDGKCDYVLREIRAIKEICGNKILKVIIETCMLDENEKIQMCKIVTESGADFIKTSTGFGSAGATFADVELFAKHIGSGVKIKAAGGISSFDDAEKFIELGASRLGTSRLVKILNAQQVTDEY